MRPIGLIKYIKHLASLFFYCVHLSLLFRSNILQNISDNNIPSEYIHFFNITAGIINVAPFEVEEQKVALYDIVNIEWYHWEMSSIRVKQAGRDIKKLMNLNSYQNCRQDLAVKKEDIEIAESGFL